MIPDPARYQFNETRHFAAGITGTTDIQRITIKIIKRPGATTHSVPHLMGLHYKKMPNFQCEHLTLRQKEPERDLRVEALDWEALTKKDTRYKRKWKAKRKSRT